jgi:hypothetical protein
VKIANVLPLVDQQRAAEMVAMHYGEPVLLAQIQVARLERLEISAGF